jgi:PTS system mannose-specific IID component
VKVRSSTLARCFWRSLFIQATWNRRGLQNLGFAYCIEPALRDLYPDPEARREALRRHIGFFNCHPYTAAAILGGAIFHEARTAEGAEPPTASLAYKQTLQGPLAALGDGFFWTALRPLFGALAALGALVIGWPAIVAALVLYNVIHLALRIGLFRDGYLKGDAMIGDIARLSLPVVAERLRAAGAVLCGLSGGLLLARGAGHFSIVPAAIAAGAAALGYWALGRGARLLPVTYAVILAVTSLALVASRWYGSS